MYILNFLHSQAPALLRGVWAKKKKIIGVDHGRR
jgi:hypothetical protein